jgi:hypothetical protein
MSAKLPKVIARRLYFAPFWDCFAGHDLVLAASLKEHCGQMHGHKTEHKLVFTNDTFSYNGQNQADNGSLLRRASCTLTNWQALFGKLSRDSYQIYSYRAI